MNTDILVKRPRGRQKTHGLTKHLLYGVWRAMRDRCQNEKHEYYKNYGGRGITVCAEWINDFKAFYDWAIANGWKEGLELDRKKNNGNYEPSNCRFVTRVVNSRNRRSNLVFEYMGRSQSVAEWAEDIGIDYSVLYREIRKSKKENPADILHRLIQ